MRAGYTVTTLRQSENPSIGKAPRHEGPKRPHGWKAIWRALSSLSLTSMGLCIKNLSQEAKLWIPGSTATFFGDCVKKCEDNVPNFDENTHGWSPWQRTGSHCRHHPTISVCTQNSCYPPPSVLIWRPVTSSYFLKWNWNDAVSIPLRISRTERRICLTLSQKELPVCCPKVEETVGTVSTCGRELLRGWRRPIGLMVSFMIFTALVRKILDPPTYDSSHKCDRACSLWTATPLCSKYQSKYCVICIGWFRTEKYFQNHMTLKLRGRLHCRWRQICQNFSFTITSGSQYECFKIFCNYLNKIQTSGHFCYVAPLKPRNLTSRFLCVFFGTDRTQVSSKAWWVLWEYVEIHMCPADVIKVRSGGWLECRL